MSIGNQSFAVGKEFFAESLTLLLEYKSPLQLGAIEDQKFSELLRLLPSTFQDSALLAQGRSFELQVPIETPSVPRPLDTSFRPVAKVSSRHQSVQQ